MLPQALRLRRSADIVSVLRRGRKVARPTLVLYARASGHPRFGVIVSRQVGGAVQRNQVKRRLRHCAYDLIDQSHPMDVVVRALPRAGRDGAGLRGDITSAWAEAQAVVA